MVANALPHAHVVLFDPPTNRKIPSLRPQYLKCAGFADTGWKTLTLSCLPVDKVRRMKLWRNVKISGSPWYIHGLKASYIERYTFH